jgi:N-acyl-D-amino-acid deacylase
MMFQRPDRLAGHDAEGKPKSSFYSLGWSVVISENGQMSAGHGGSLPGTNTRLAPHTSRVVSALLPELEAAIDKVQAWPEHDLFEQE